MLHIKMLNNRVRQVATEEFGATMNARQFN
jgi:hypothetical protein